MCYILLLSLAVIGGATARTNVALNKPAYQQTTYDANGIATHATDGFRDGYWSHRRCSGTKKAQTEPWLVVDLLEEVSVTEVRIQHRSDANSPETYFKDAHVAVGNNFDPTNQASFDPKAGFEICGDLPVSTGTGSLQDVECPTPLRGRYVVLYLSGTNKYLTFCELEVSADDSGLIETATRQPTFGSSTYSTFPMNRATDGNYDGLINNLHVAMTKNTEQRPWIAVDMGRRYIVKFVTIKNREDAHGSRLHDLYVAVGQRFNPDPASPFIDLRYWSFCGFYPGPYDNGDIVVSECKKAISSRFVIIYLEDPEYLQVTELNVYSQAN